MVNSRKARVPLRVFSTGGENFGWFPFDYSQPPLDAPRNNRPTAWERKNAGKTAKRMFDIPEVRFLYSIFEEMPSEKFNPETSAARGATVISIQW